MDAHKDLVPFSNQSPLVPGRRGSVLTRWKLVRDKQALREQIIDLAAVIRRLSEELLEELIFLRDPKRTAPEAIQRRMSQISGALKRESGALTSLFDLADLHPALQRIFLQKLPDRGEAPDETAVIDLLAAPPAVPEKQRKPVLFDLLTPRETDILTMVLADEKIRDIAAKLCVKKHTVFTHIAAIKQKARQLAGKEGPTP